MDPFEKEYFDKIGKIAGDFRSRRRELAKSRIKMFAASICEQVIKYKTSFDLLAGAGNSGLFMTKIAETTYSCLGLTCPPVLTIPVYRFTNDNVTLNDNSALLPQVKDSIREINDIKKILFVDDEIMRALTAKASLTLISNAMNSKRQIYATIIAEDHFFEWHYKVPDISILFFAYSRLIQGLNGIVSHFITDSFYQKITEARKDLASYNRVMAIVINGALKTRDESGKQYFDRNIENKLNEQITDYNNTKQILQDELTALVKEGVEEYKSGKIRFRY